MIIRNSDIETGSGNFRNEDRQEEKLYSYRYPHPAVTADCVIFGFDGKSLRILLVERGNEPYLGYWALPGGFMRINESIEETAARELKEETNLSGIFLDQFRVYSRPDRDPRERVITVAFIALVKPDDLKVIAGDDAAKAMWFFESMLPPLAFDHQQIIREAREHLKKILRLKPVAFELLNKVFSISELQTVYEVINQTTYDRRNFLRTALDSEVISVVEQEDAHSGSPVSKASRGLKMYTASSDIVKSDDKKPEAKRDMHIDLSDTQSDLSRDILEWPSASKEMAIYIPSFCECDCWSEWDDGGDSRSSDKISEERIRPSGSTILSKPQKAPTKGLFDFMTRKTKR